MLQKRTTCGSGAGDSQITTYNSTATGTSISYNDDGCGLLSTVTWVANFTGTLYIQVNTYNCVSSATCYRLDVTCTSCAPPAGSCSYTLDMFDSFGDGWNGASLQILVNGVLQNTFTLASGFSGTVTFSVANQCDVVVLNFVSGTFDNEIAYDLYQQPNLVIPIFSADYFLTALIGPVFNTTCGTGCGGPALNNTTCGAMAPICTQTGVSYPAATSAVNAPAGPNYNCLLSTPDPTWWYFEISQSGNIDMALSAPADIDFIIWGPFATVADAQTHCTNFGQAPTATNGAVIDCSFNATNFETPSIAGAVVGQIYVMMITNFAGVAQNISLTQTGGAGATNCVIVNCAADAGTVTSRLNGNIVTSPVLLCKGSCLTVETDSNFVLPTPVVGEQAELMYAIYDGPPNPAITDPALDPNFTTLFWTGGDFNDCNNPSSIILGAALGNNIWLVPITMDDGDNNGNPNAAINYDNNTDNCYDMGTPVEIVFLDSIRAAFLPTCSNIVVTLSGGYPGYNPLASYTVTNTGAGTMTQSGTRGQTLTFTGYTSGQTISFNVSNDGNSCSRSFSYTAPTTSSVTLNTLTNTSCAANVGAIDISVTGATCTYTLNMTDSYGDGWNGGFLTIRANGTPVPGSPFSVSAAQGTSASATITIPAGQTLQLTYTSGTWENENAYTLIQNGTTIFSAGPTPGTGIVFTTTCSPAYTYAWSNSAITQDIASLAAGVYNVTITDPTGCTFTGGPYTVTAPAAPTATATSTNVACNGGTTGTVTLTPAGGTAAYSFLWSNGRTTQNNTGLAAGTYTVTVTDANGCTTTSSATVTEPTALASSTVTITDATCSLAGAIDINVSGGTSGYTFNWSNGATSEDLTGLSAGAFSVTITDANGCSATNGPNTVAAIGTPTASLVTSSDVSCTGNNDGTIDISVSGGTPGYTFLWSNAATTEDINGLSAGTYNVTVSDNLGCIATITTIVISEPTAISVTNTSNNVSCNAAANGAISLTVAGGSPNYSFLWSNGSTNEDLTGLNGGNYTVTVTDANGCVRTVGPLNIAEPTAIAVSNINPTDASCGNNDGTITLNTSGGTGGYSFAWSNGLPNTATPSNLAGGTYNVTVTDANGCTFSPAAINVGSGSNITITLSSVDEACGQPNSGAVALTINGGTAPYSFVWNNAATTQNLSAIAAGTYSVTVTDADACTTSGAATVAPAFQPTLNAGVLPTMATDTTITWGDVSNITGGNDQTAQGVTYTWTATGPANANVNFGNANAHQTSIEPSADGDYTLVLTATSTDGCVSTDTIQISVIANDPQIPSAFSPNGDNSNETFQVVRLEKSLLVEFKVYNRWGQIVYDDATEGQWDGTFKGADQPRDVYIYVISWTSGAETVVKRGPVTLLR